MPTPTDPAPCSDGQNLYECLDCGEHVCSDERVRTCPECGGKMQNLTKPRGK